MTSTVTIRSAGPLGQAVIVEIDGVPFTNCSKIEFDPIIPDALVTARLTVIVDELDVELADALFQKDTRCDHGDR